MVLLRKSLQKLVIFSYNGISATYQKGGQCCFPIRSVSSYSMEKFYSLVPVTFQTHTPGDPMTMNIGVYDNKVPSMTSETPLVVTLHGVPGSSKDFDVLGLKLQEKGIRVIGLDFPGFGKSKLVGMDMYKLDHTTEGRYKMLKSILDALLISRIDILVSHSAGTWLGYKAAADLDLVKSAVFLNPLGARPHRTMRPLPVLKLTSAAARIPLLHSSFHKLLPYVYKKVGFVLEEDDFPCLLMSVETVRRTNLDKMQNYAERAKKRNLPFVMLITRNDKIVESSLSMEMAHFLGVGEGETTEYDREGSRIVGKSVGKYDDSHFRRVLVFERGGHVAQRAHVTEIVRHISQLLTVIGK